MSALRLVFSRKGFDSGVGKVASPIFEDGSMLSLPIPSSRYGAHRVGELHGPHGPLGPLVEDLTKGEVKRDDWVHLDPDLVRDSAPGKGPWQTAFGQIGASQGHLASRGVVKGDVFLFFGWFRRVHRVGDRWRYVPGSADVHVLFGWLQIAEVLSIGRHGRNALREHLGLTRHPHVLLANRFNGLNNTIYLAAKHLTLDNSARGVPGSGVFRRFSPALQLTQPGSTRGVWALPKCFWPHDGLTPLSFHSNRDRWSWSGDQCVLRTVGRGQEFVLDCDQYPDVIGWLTNLIATSA